MVTICIVEPSSLSPYNPGSPWNLEGFQTTTYTYSQDRNKFSGHHSQIHPVLNINTYIGVHLKLLQTKFTSSGSLIVLK